MNLVSLFAAVPLPLVAAWLAANLIPYLSALVTRTPSWATGVVTLALSAADGLLAELAKGSAFDWRAGVGTAFGAWAVASLHHAKVLKGTQLEAVLHSVGAPTQASPAPAPSAPPPA